MSFSSSLFILTNINYITLVLYVGMKAEEVRRVTSILTRELRVVCSILHQKLDAKPIIDWSF